MLYSIYNFKVYDKIEYVSIIYMSGGFQIYGKINKGVQKSNIILQFLILLIINPKQKALSKNDRASLKNMNCLFCRNVMFVGR